MKGEIYVFPAEGVQDCRILNADGSDKAKELFAKGESEALGIGRWALGIGH
jgi:hypothetical protein